MNLDPYLVFDGDCRDAFEFYRQSFGGEFATIQTFGQGPAGMGVREEHLDLVMHVSLPIGSSVLMGSDYIEGFGPPLKSGNNFFINVHADSREEADELFAKLSSEGGAVRMPMQDMFWGSYYGDLTDKFGVSWQIRHG